MSERLSDYDFELPPDRIAQRPVPGRDGSRLLRLDLDGGPFADHRFRDLPDLLQPGDLLVVNDTKVLPARLLGNRGHEEGAAAEVLPHSPGEDGRWLALVRPSKRFREGDRFLAAGGRVEIAVEERGGDGDRWLRLIRPDDWEEAMTIAGAMPLPPYIDRAADARDLDEYQTRFARRTGAVAAPTAGLHFSDALLGALAERGIERHALTLHVGIGTFRPVREENPADHPMHSERFLLPAETRRAVDAARAEGRRVIAVGTTVVRSLESLTDDEWDAPGDHAGETRLFIRPPFRFRRIDGLVSNFHLPRSTLLMLVSALAGRERVLAAYRHAVESGYRFFSYGDAMLFLPGGAR